jgi:hypothetical protein
MGAKKMVFDVGATCNIDEMYAAALNAGRSRVRFEL